MIPDIPIENTKDDPNVLQHLRVPCSVPDPSTAEVTGDTTEWVDVIVYADHRAMLAAANAYNGCQDPDEDLDEAPPALTQAINGRALLDEDDDPPRATVRIWVGRLTRSVLLHELVHATQVVYAWSYLAAADGNPWAVDNEDYAYLLQITFELANHGIRWEHSTAPGGPDARWVEPKPNDRSTKEGP